MSDVNTSREEVELLIVQLDGLPPFAPIVATLRALLTERDEALADWKSEMDMHRDEHGRRMQVEAERDRLREALRKVRDELGGSGQTHASLLRAFNIAYAALKEMGHE